jgi:hypothetical protein
LSEATQPGFQYSASSETKGMPVISDSRLANVDLPDPDDPMTRTRCIGSIRDYRMIRKSGRRFSEAIMRKTER